MLRRIRPDEVQLGMFVHGFDGRWLSHPFWRSKFLVETDDVLERLRTSTVEAIIVDDERSVKREADDSVARLRRRMAAPPVLVASAEPPAEPVTVEADIARVIDTGDTQRMIERAQHVMKQMFDGAARGVPVPEEDVAAVVGGVSRALRRNKSVLLGITRLKNKDHYTYAHSVAVCALMINLGRELGMTEGEVQELGTAGLLHDIGKSTIATAILNKPGALTDSEAALVRQHVVRGHEMLKSAGHVSETALDVCLHHHERLDGTGYPFGLKGEAIGKPVRIASICDVYDAMTSVRAYKNALSPPDAVAAMSALDRHFDRDVLFAFMRSVGVFPTGMLVRLASDQLAVVLPNGRHTGRPRVRAFHSTKNDMPIPPHDLILLDRTGEDRIVEEATADEWQLGNWPSLRERLMARRMAA